MPIITYLRTRSKGALQHTVTQNTIYQLFGKFFTAISGLLTTRLVAQNYGQSGVGEFTLIFNFINIFYLVTDFGVNAIVVKQMVEKPDDEQRLYNGLLGLRICASVILTIAGVLLLMALPYNTVEQTGFSPAFKQGAILMLVTIVTQSAYLSALTVIQRRLLYKISTIALSVGTLTTLGIFYVLVSGNWPLNAALTAFIIGNVVASGLAIWQLPFDRSRKFSPILSIKFWKTFLIPAIPIAATLILNVLYFRSDAFILAKLRPLAEVGIYGIAYKIFEQAIVIPVFFMNALYPLLVQQVAHDQTKLYKTLKIATLVLAGTGSLLAILIIVFSPLLIKIISDDAAFSPAQFPLTILAAGLPFFFVSNLYLWLLVTLGKQKYLLLIYGVTMAINIIGNIILIPTYSYVAAAYLTIISEALVLVLTVVFGMYFLHQQKRHAISHNEISLET